MQRVLLHTIFLLLIAGDLVFSYQQHYAQPLDGDLPGILDQNLDPLFEHPFGFETIANDLSYPNPNRFFSHWAIKQYMLHAPLWLQTFLEPVDSVYAACALVKTMGQLALLLLISTLIIGHFRPFDLSFLAISALLSVLFQTFGYVRYMGIIDPAITYVFFYALPAIVLFLTLMPLLLWGMHGKPIIKSRVGLLAWTALAVVSCLSGPLNAGVIAAGTVIFALNLFLTWIQLRKNEEELSLLRHALHLLPKQGWYMLSVLLALACYSIFLGSYSSTIVEAHIELIDRFARLPKGVFYLLVGKPGFLFMGIAITLMLFFNKTSLSERQKSGLKRTAIALGAFALVYIALLPFGGYRDYRSNILRYDTFLPITLCLIFYFGFVVRIALKNSLKKGKQGTIAILVLIAFLFTNADRRLDTANQCQRNLIYQLQVSTQHVNVLPNDCVLLTWQEVTKSEKTQRGSALLQHWNILDSEKLWVQSGTSAP